MPKGLLDDAVAGGLHGAAGGTMYDNILDGLLVQPNPPQDVFEVPQNLQPAPPPKIPQRADPHVYERIAYHWGYEELNDEAIAEIESNIKGQFLKDQSEVDASAVERLRQMGITDIDGVPIIGLTPRQIIGLDGNGYPVYEPGEDPEDVLSAMGQ